MAYLRIRNGYGYVCKKVKKEGHWKEETIIGLGRIKNEEDKKRMQWIAKEGRESELNNKDFGFEDLLDDFRELLGDTAKGRELVIKNEWEYPEDDNAVEVMEGDQPYITKDVGVWYSPDKEGKIILTPVFMVCGGAK